VTGRYNKADREATKSRNEAYNDVRWNDEMRSDNGMRSYNALYLIPVCIRDDAAKIRRKRRRHTLTYVEEHSDAADKGSA
jgi:hypothetical protein